MADGKSVYTYKFIVYQIVFFSPSLLIYSISVQTMHSNQQLLDSFGQSIYTFFHVFDISNSLFILVFSLSLADCYGICLYIFNGNC